MRKFLSAIATTAIIALGTAGVTQSALAEASVSAEISGDFIRKQKSIKGSWQIVERGDQTVIVFNDDFTARSGPDLKVFLSPTSISDVTGKTATDGSILISALTSNKGGQEYVVPEGVDLSNYSSLLVHCEAYSVLWGGADL